MRGLSESHFDSFLGLVDNLIANSQHDPRCVGNIISALLISLTLDQIPEIDLSQFQSGDYKESVELYSKIKKEILERGSSYRSKQFILDIENLLGEVSKKIDSFQREENKHLAIKRSQRRELYKKYSSKHNLNDSPDDDDDVTEILVEDVVDYTIEEEELIEMKLEDELIKTMKKNSDEINQNAISGILVNGIGALSRMIENFTKEHGFLFGGKDILNRAVLKNDVELVRKVLDFGFDPCNLFNEKNALHCAAEVEGINDDIVSMIYHAAKNKSALFVKIENSKEVRSSSPIHIASRIGNISFLNSLKKVAKDDFVNYVNLRNGGGNTALYFAAENGDENVVRFLLDHDANPEICNNMGNAPLHVAIEGHRLNTVKILLNVKDASYADFPSKEQVYPIHFAVRSGNYRIVEEVINHGANVNILTKGGKITPLDIAESRLDLANKNKNKEDKNCYENIVSLLQERGGLNFSSIPSNNPLMDPIVSKKTIKPANNDKGGGFCVLS